MFSRKKKKKISDITILNQGEVLYSGTVLELPLTEETIIKSSILFFNDSDPCYIHRGAVRARLTAELETLLTSEESFHEFEKLQQQTGFPDIDTILYDGKTFQK